MRTPRLGGRGCSPDPRRGADEARPESPEPPLPTVSKADHLTLYDGLPHPVWEAERLEKEKRTRETVDIHGYPFYRKSLPLTKADGDRLRELLADARSFAANRGPKKCGGFHPDYCVQWRVGDRNYDCLICFGCYEIKAYGPGGEEYLDIEGDAYKRLKEVLTPYRENRPA